MRFVSLFSIRRLAALFFAIAFSIQFSHGQNTVNLRVMAANLNGNSQTYQPSALRIFQGLKPDVVAIQEFNYSNNADSDIRAMVDTAFGTNFYYYREPYTSGGLPNGIISRYPIVNAGSWADTEVANRGFAWAQIQLPGNMLYVVSVHLLTSSAGERAIEATELQSLMQTNFPTNSWMILAGDFNTDSRTEAGMTTLETYLSDNPIPVDNLGNSNTSENRNHPHDYVLPSFAFTNVETATVLPSHSFPGGLVFDSTVYTPLSDVVPVQFSDSTNDGAQHMPVMKDFTIPAGNIVAVTNPPTISAHPLSQTNFTGGSISFSVTAGGTTPLNYQWLFNGTIIAGATANFLSFTNLQLTNAGNYYVVITNNYGSVTSSVAILGITNAAPFIVSQPQNVANYSGQTATFSVTANGSPTLNFQWQFNGTNISGATNNSFSIINTQTTNSGNYFVAVTNSFGSVTSAVATLIVNPPVTGTTVVLAGWDMSGLLNYGSSPLTPATNAPNLTIGGLTRGSGVTVLSTAAARTWGGNNFNAVSESAAITANEFATFSIAANSGFTVSYTSLVKYDYKRSGSGPLSGVLQFQVGNGSFTDVTNFSYTSTSGASLGPIDLSGITALQNVVANTIVTFRIVNYGATSSGGNWYIYDLGASTAPDLAIQGIINSIAPATNSPAVISAPTLSNGQLQFAVSGTAGSNYIVQVSTNLTGANWLPVSTNAAPFNFTETNFAAPQKFYRVISQ